MATEEQLRERRFGRSPTGIVGLRDFDKGVVTTMGATLETATTLNGEVGRNYFLNVETVRGRVGRPGLPGVPVIFAFPESVLEKYDYPLIWIRSDDITPTMNRWHPGTLQYRAPSQTANPVVVNTNPLDPLNEPTSSWDQVEQLQQAAPYDITYSISILARNRGGMGQTNQANAIFHQVLKTYQPYSLVRVEDSLGDERTYSCFQESISHLDEVPEVADRVIGFSITIRVEAELDLLEPELHNTVTSLPTITTEVL